ncbi:right-handed parallel beta-helix repeat-containing protein [Microbacterium keratanolyticum]
MRTKMFAVVTAWVLAITGLAMVPLMAAPSAAQAATERTLFEDDFEAGDGAKWVTTGSAVSFADGMLGIRGGGPENRALSRADILADEFTLTADLFVNAGNTNSALKIGFVSTESAAARFQLTYDGPNKRLSLEKVTSSGTAKVAGPVTLDLPVNTGGAPHRVAIHVDGDRVQAAVDDVVHIDVAESGIAAFDQGRVLIAGQFPQQDFHIDNLRVVTSEPEKTGAYTLELRTKTDGVVDVDPLRAGGSVTANRASGDPGDVVTLAPIARPGFLFDGYESLRADTETSTDGLLTITDDRFSFNDKTGSVIIIAKFVTAPVDPNLLFEDSFAGAFNEHGLYAVNDPASAQVVDGALQIAPTSGPAVAFVDATAWNSPGDYEITVAARKVNAAAGTAQIAFRGAAFDDRYVLALNGSKALLRRFDAQGANVELAAAPYSFTQTSRRLTIAVSGDTVSVSSNGTPVLSYVNTDDAPRDVADWAGLPAGLALINMTPGAPVAFDDIAVSRVPVRVAVTATITDDGQPDAALQSGAVVLSAHSATEGDTLTWSVFPKGGYTLAGVTIDGVALSENRFVVAQGRTQPIALVADFVPAARAAQTFHVDPDGGDDANDGTAPASAWRTLDALSTVVFHPGDSILLKRGSVFTGAAAALRFSGSGTSDAPIVVGAYGEGARPQLNAAGAVENVITLYNQEHITVTGLEITNLDPAFATGFALNGNDNRQKNLRAVNVIARDFGVVTGIRITDLYIHDVNGNLNAKWNGGIFFDIGAAVENGELRGVPTKYHDVLIKGNVLERVDRSGIKLVSSGWANQSLQNAPGTPLHWYPSTGVVVRDNQLRYMGGDAITVRDTDGALIEYNLARHARYQNTGYNAGIWPFQATNTVVQYNEVSHTHGVQDGQGLDTDHVSSYTVMQYNYSHDNEGGFMLIMNGFPHTAPTIRYNVSQNDADKTFEFARGTAAGTMIYNNTISSDSLLQGPRGGVLDLANSAAGTGNREVFLFNNVFHYPEGQKFYVGEAATMKTRAKLFNNSYSGGIAVPEEEERPLTADPGLIWGSAPNDTDATVPLTGAAAEGHFDGYTPGETSPLRGAGVTLDEAVAHFGGTITDRRALSPTEIHALALQGESIDFAAGRFLPDVAGVGYGTDFLGTALPGSDSAEGITMGAIQYADPSSTGPDGGGDGGGDPDEGGGGDGGGDLGNGNGTGGGTDGENEGSGGDTGSAGGSGQGAGDAEGEAASGAPLAVTGAEVPLGMLLLGAFAIVIGLAMRVTRRRVR